MCHGVSGEDDDDAPEAAAAREGAVEGGPADDAAVDTVPAVLGVTSGAGGPCGVLTAPPRPPLASDGVAAGFSAATDRAGTPRRAARDVDVDVALVVVGAVSFGWCRGGAASSDDDMPNEGGAAVLLTALETRDDSRP